MFIFYIILTLFFHVKNTAAGSSNCTLADFFWTVLNRGTDGDTA